MTALTPADLAAQAKRLVQEAIDFVPDGFIAPVVETRDAAFRIIDALAAATREPSAVPEGWVLMPIEPTEAMLKAAIPKPDEFGQRSAWPSDTYRAMLAAAPHPSAQPAEPKERKQTIEEHIARLRAEGYHELADVVARHHGIGEQPKGSK